MRKVRVKYFTRTLRALYANGNLLMKCAFFLSMAVGRLIVLRPSYKAPAAENHLRIHSSKLLDVRNLLGLGRLATDLEYPSIRLTKHLKTSDWTEILDFQLAEIRRQLIWTA